MSTTVFLVRHAKHSLVDHVLVGRMADVPLSEEGRREAASLANWFSAYNVTIVQSSPRRRARETADPVAAAAGVPVEIVAALDEIDVGQWTGRSFAELAGDPCWQAWNASRSATRAPGGETMMEVQRRMLGHIHHVGQTLRTGCAVLVSHCDVIKAALLHFLGRPIDAYGELDVTPGSVSTVEIGPSGACVVTVNGRRLP